MDIKSVRQLALKDISNHLNSREYLDGLSKKDEWSRYGSEIYNISAKYLEKDKSITALNKELGIHKINKQVIK